MRHRYVRNDRDERRSDPLYGDVHYGSGGIAGGKFTHGQTDTLSMTAISDSGTAQAGGSTSITLRSGASSTDDFHNGMSLQITAGTGSGQDHQEITDYDGTTKVATVSGAWTTTPDSTSQYRIVNRDY